MPGAPTLVRRLFELARDEDLGVAGDITSQCCVDAGARGAAALVLREQGVVAGLAVLPMLLEVFRADVTLERAASDGDAIGPGTTLGLLRGRLRDVLAVERTALNLVARLSAIATLARSYAERVAGTGAAIYDTRKTTPGLRVLEKHAVHVGGGRCHRLGLHDAVLIKDNHIASVPVAELAAFVRDAAARARAAHPAGAGLFIEVEADTLEQVEAILRDSDSPVTAVLLDNMPPDRLRAAVSLRKRLGAERVLLEASGGVRLDTVRAIAETGVERISVGELTRGVASLDVGLDREGA